MIFVNMFLNLGFYFCILAFLAIILIIFATQIPIFRSLNDFHLELINQFLYISFIIYRKNKLQLLLTNYLDSFQINWTFEPEDHGRVPFS